ncbi:gamma-butyrobetaine hydroxylase [Ophiostoma piceae UAMH 11346]|uniref:Gamma-butyrobetaine hydroxylase n=1 Tax=Ophiostoma piceae (strain UAMH 11346) TaxID=1262450 RepID=S3C6G8_OPHP1|nr:gamma-butyrobetaine hydroxylase [Ophiostoma piceae UAMH 11346]
MLRITGRLPARRSVLAALRPIATAMARTTATATATPPAPEPTDTPGSVKIIRTFEEQAKVFPRGTRRRRKTKKSDDSEEFVQRKIAEHWSTNQLEVLQKRKDVLHALAGEESLLEDKCTPPRFRTHREIALGVRKRTRYDIHNPLPAADKRGPQILTDFRYNDQQNLLELDFNTNDKVVFTASTSTLWVRDLCQCSKCVTPASGQKEVMTHDLDQHPKIKRITAYSASGKVVHTADKPVSELAKGEKEDGLIKGKRDDIAKLVITWDDGAPFASKKGGEHESEFEPADLLLKMSGLIAPATQAMPQRQLWDRARIEALQKPVQYADWMAKTGQGNDEKTPEFYRALTDLHRLGLIVVDGVPDVETAVRDIASEVGHVQPTFYGEMFDVVSKPPTEAENVAYTSVHLGLHQDLLYMNDSPRIQLLHCLRNDCEGGESLFSDSMRAAVEMQLRYPYYAMALAHFQVPYHYERNGNYYYNERPVFEMDNRNGSAVADLQPYGKRPLRPYTYQPYNTLIRHTAWSPPFQGTFQPMTYVDHPDHRASHLGDAWDATKDTGRAYADPKTLSQQQQAVDYRLRFEIAYRRSRLEYWHEAVRIFEDILNSERNLFDFKLKPGQCVLFDNRRVLHGRRQFTPVKEAVIRDYPRWLKGTYLSDQVFRSRVTDMVLKDKAPAGTVPPALGWTPEHALLDEQVQVLTILEKQGTPLWDSVKLTSDAKPEKPASANSR